MCGRFYFSRAALERMRADWPNLFDGLEEQVIDNLASGDVRPTNQILTIAGGPRMQLARWGWKREFNGAVINARVEKLTRRFRGRALACLLSTSDAARELTG